MIPGWLLIEETVQGAVEAELAVVYAAISNSTIDAYLALVFANLPLPKRDKLKAYLAEHDVRVLIGYPRDAAELPCVAVTIDPESEREFVGETGVTYIDDDTRRATEAGMWTSTIGLLIYAEHGELVRWIYQIVKYGLSRRRQELTAAGVMECHLSGRDFGFDPRFLQAGRFVHRRALQVELTYLQHDLRDRDDITDVETPGTGVVGSLINGFVPPA